MFLQIFSFIEQCGTEDFKGTIGYLHNLFTLTVGEWMGQIEECRATEIWFYKVTFLSIYSDLVVSRLFDIFFFLTNGIQYQSPTRNYLSEAKAHCELARPSNRPYFEFLSAGSKPLARCLGSGQSFPFSGTSVAGSLWGHRASPEIPIAT